MIDQIDGDDKDKALLATLMRESLRGANAMARNELRDFLVAHFNEEDGLTLAGLGTLAFELIMCTCPLGIEVEPEEAHNPDCEMWDSKASPPDEEELLIARRVRECQAVGCKLSLEECEKEQRLLFNMPGEE